MTEPAFGQATFIRDGGVVQARMSRVLEDDAANVWAALVEPEKLVQWLAPGTIEPRKGGIAKLNFTDSGIVIDSKVTEFEPGRLLEYSWSGPGEPTRPLRFEISPDTNGVKLTLTLRVPASEDAGRACAGFDAHLDMLAAALASVPIKFPFELFKAARDAYRKELSDGKQ